MLISHSNPGLLLFDPEIERTLHRARQARRRAELARLASDNILFDWSDSDSDSNTQTTSSDTSTLTMGERLTLKQIGGASTVFDNQPNRFTELNANFEVISRILKSSVPPLEGPVVTKTLLKHSLYHSLWMIERKTDTTLCLPKTTSKGVYEVAPSDSTVLAKSLVDIAAILKEIKEGQQVTPTLLKRQPGDSQQKPVKHSRICSCNSHHTDECPQLQEDNTVASTHNFYDATTNSPYNRQYYTQGGRDNQFARWIPPQQQQAQLRQLYTYSQPQNSQNLRYQPLHNRQQYSPSNNPPFNYDEAIRIVQKENQEMMEALKRTEAHV
ncbi:hypothetical protein PIB30_070914 [Stylosanthes scabra]|uniref:Uncharacterized protein n=1 Tax=Stylosanthes scabra TaxID=79078 RepID=A0ABU6WNK4_9FABA|nr:hypothetical protein [Stylosanthes scabra]